MTTVDGIQSGVFLDCFLGRKISFYVSLHGLGPGPATSSSLGSLAQLDHRGAADVSQRGQALHLSGADHCPGSEPRSNGK